MAYVQDRDTLSLSPMTYVHVRVCLRHTPVKPDDIPAGPWHTPILPDGVPVCVELAEGEGEDGAGIVAPLSYGGEEGEFFGRSEQKTIFSTDFAIL